MSSQSPTPAIPSFATTLIHSLAQKGATIAGAWLVTHGALAAGDQTQAAQVLGGAIVLGAGLIWTYVRSQIDTARAKALANAPAISPPVA